MAEGLDTLCGIMKMLKVKDNQLLFLIFTFFYSLDINAIIVSHCFDRPIQVACIPGINDKFSLEGEYIIKVDGKNKKYEFCSRRAWADWCTPTLKKIKRVMSEGRFCIEGDVASAKDTLMGLEGFFSSRSQWTYFDEYKVQSRTIAQLQESKIKKKSY